jgi:hypothetical protein
MNRKQTLVLTLVLALWTVSGCGNKEDELSGGIKTSNTASAQSTGIVLGKVVLKGTPPPPERLSAVTDPFCSNVNGGSVPDETVVAGADGALANVFVYVKEVPGEYPPSSKPVILDQKDCIFIPHVLGVQVGQPFHILNSDKTLNVPHLRSKNNEPLNIGQISGAPPIKVKFTKPEVMMGFVCDAHPWEGCYVGVLSHPFYYVTRKDGVFKIKGLPPGSYTLVAWQEKYGESSQKVEIKEGATQTVDFTFSAK